MACLEMFNTDQKSLYAPMSPRISFSNDFVDGDLVMKHERATSTATEPSDFEFSVKDYTMIAADEIFFKGRLLPLKDNCTAQAQLQKLTLREELLHADEWNVDDACAKPPKAPTTRWKEILGLKKTSFLGKKHDKGDGAAPGRSTDAALQVGREAHLSIGVQEFDGYGCTKTEGTRTTIM